MRLSIRSVVVGTFMEVGRHWRALSRALVTPAAFVAILEIAEDRLEASYGWMALLLSFCGFAVYAMFAVSCHRIVLLGSDPLPNAWGVYWTARETRFLGWSVILSVLALPSALPIFLVPFMVDMVDALGADPRALYLLAIPTFFLFGVPFFYAICRLSLVLPSTAIDERPRIHTAWVVSRNNGWRLAAGLSLPVAPLTILFILLEELRSTDGPGFTLFVAGFGFYLIGALEIAALSVAFRELTSAQATAPR